MLFKCEHCEEDVPDIYATVDGVYLCWPCLPRGDKGWHQRMEERLRKIRESDVAHINAVWHTRKLNSVKPLKSINGTKLQ